MLGSDPPSWKSADQSSRPPIGWMTSINAFRATSIGAQKTRAGLLPGRDSISKMPRSPGRGRSIPKLLQGHLERREHAGATDRPKSHTREARNRRRDVPRALASSSPSPKPVAERLVGGPSSQSRSVEASSSRHSAAASASSLKPKRLLELVVVSAAPSAEERETALAIDPRRLENAPGSNSSSTQAQGASSSSRPRAGARFPGSFRERPCGASGNGIRFAVDDGHELGIRRWPAFLLVKSG